MKHREYIGYTCWELLEDEFFLQSHLYPTDETDRFWREQEVLDNGFAEELSKARSLIQAVPFRDCPLLPQAREDLLNRIRATVPLVLRRKKRRRLVYVSAAACVAVLCVFIGYYLRPESTISQPVDLAYALSERPAAPLTDVQLIDHQQRTLTIDGQEPVVSLDEEGGLFINAEKVENEAPAGGTMENTRRNLSQLLVPSGKRTFLTLSDGSKVWVNANSRVIYPDVFEKDRREIAVEGEVFIEVFHDSKRPFYVKTQTCHIRVSGTKFNVSAYEADKHLSVVLVEGRVDVSTSSKDLQRTLRPNELLHLADGKMDVKKVNVANYISWINGTYTFDYESFPVVLDRLSRYYGKHFRWEAAVEKLYCSGSLNLKDDICRVLQGLELAVPVQFIETESGIEVIIKP
jgi:ferric-dicitrate binding protein FerR (iron transport regulator)